MEDENESVALVGIDGVVTVVSLALGAVVDDLLEVVDPEDGLACLELARHTVLDLDAAFTVADPQKTTHVFVRLEKPTHVHHDAWIA